MNHIEKLSIDQAIHLRLVFGAESAALRFNDNFYMIQMHKKKHYIYVMS